MMPFYRTLFFIINLGAFGLGVMRGDVFDLPSSNYIPRSRPDFDLADIPCDLSDTTNTCGRPGPSYPWSGMHSYIRDNQGMIKRMYGDTCDRSPDQRAQGPNYGLRQAKQVEKHSTPIVNACPSDQFVITPFWANNSEGMTLAVVNFHPFEQAVQQEVCKPGQTGRCRDGCLCDQKYSWYRLLAFDPRNECKGIFMDWFQFPSCCACHCFELPPEPMSGVVTNVTNDSGPFDILSPRGGTLNFSSTEPSTASVAPTTSPTLTDQGETATATETETEAVSNSTTRSESTTVAVPTTTSPPSTKVTVNSRQTLQATTSRKPLPLPVSSSPAPAAVPASAQANGVLYFPYAPYRPPDRQYVRVVADKIINRTAVSVSSTTNKPFRPHFLTVSKTKTTASLPTSATSTVTATATSTLVTSAGLSEVIERAFLDPSANLLRIVPAVRKNRVARI